MIKQKLVPNRVVMTTAVLVLALAPLSRGQGEFKSFKVDAALLPRMKEVASAANMDRWPRSDSLRLAPEIGKDMLLTPSRITDDRVTYSTEGFQDNAGVRASWDWMCLQDNPDGVPSTLPEVRREGLLRRLSEERRKDPNYVQERLSRALERYQRSKRRKLVGSLRVDVCCALDAITAQEFLISLASNSSNMPTELVVAYFSEAARLEGVGEVAFNHGWLMFVRDNIAVAIRGDGQVEEEVLPLAHKIDDLIQKQTVLTRSQLDSLRPVISVSDSARRTAPDSARRPTRGLHAVDYSVSTSGSQKVASLRAQVITADGTIVPQVMDGRILFSAPGSTARVRVEVITNSLLARVLGQPVVLLEE